MRRLIATLAAVALVSSVGSAGKHDIKPSVGYAPSWAAAVEEAKLLNVPIVVHSHGFF